MFSLIRIYHFLIFGFSKRRKELEDRKKSNHDKDRIVEISENALKRILAA